ncbi:glutamate-ammonia-ligase adenylyltransferase [Galliscardovia ingluviei]|uniref:Glutamate-ammonia-ligase adenylyltransferase n=1 Tax=Galliscardovia ingluviei TaxID=1769422 RepID=A0A8J3AII8_9BIFI|nr:glutamate-ammonia-ligase adenylyltransferase [Galliscardovia ingluviei]
MTMPVEPQASLSARTLIRAGLADIQRARTLCEQLDSLHIDRYTSQDVLLFLPTCADPDTALYYSVQIAQAVVEQHTQKVLSELSRTALQQLIAVLGSSEAMGRYIASRPALLQGLGVSREDILVSIKHRQIRMKQALCAAVPQLNTLLDYWQQASSASADEHDDVSLTHPDALLTATQLAHATTALRYEYRRQLLEIMAVDTTAGDIVEIQPSIATALSDIADCALHFALALAQLTVAHAHECAFAVIGMGKLGARELNYVSDVDLMYVVEPKEGSEIRGEALTRLGTKIATTMQRIIQSPMPGVHEGPLWQIDTALRPEGKDGPLVRTLTSYMGYYEHWAENWEFQALLKARCTAGDTSLGDQFVQRTRSLVWSASGRPNFVHDCQRMRQRVESLIPPALKDREIKLGKGGLRDVEFTVQMLQLVHGRTDATLHVRATLEALRALASEGYVSRNQAIELASDYSFERVLEHRVQMWSLHRTHLFPDLGEGSIGGLESPRQIEAGSLDTNVELRRLARALHVHPEQLVERFDTTRQRIRRLHLEIYYRPMLPNIATLGDNEISLSPEATRARFEAIGFADPDNAMRHVQALTAGVSRAAKINRIILPAVLQWLADGQNPDMGLLAWRKLEEQFGQGSEYLGFLRDSQSAGRRLCHVLSNSRFLADAIAKSMESLTWLGNNELLTARSRESLQTQASGALVRYADRLEEIATVLRAMRRQEIERIGLGWMSSVISDSQAITAMSDVIDVIIDSAVHWSIEYQTRTRFGKTLAHIAVIALGRYGGAEVNFCSDADVMLLYEPYEGADEVQAQQFAKAVTDDIRKILMGPVSTEGRIELDLDLRPEGKNGPLIRSLQSCREYYDHWASTWERQALLRARFAAGDQHLGERFIQEVVNPFRYLPRTLHENELTEIRTLKARMEAERLPRGVAKDRHMKLGKGGLSDAEWTIQLLQLQVAHQYDDVQVTSTLLALDALEAHDCITGPDAQALRTAWILATNARNANYVWSGNANRCDILPDDTYSLGGIAAVLKYPARHGQDFENEILSAMRRCREVTERLFYARNS